MESGLLNGVTIYAPKSKIELMQYAISNRKILVAINAEKILHATGESRSIINRNLGYPDGMGAVWGLRKKGFIRTEKIPGCELWLNIIQEYNLNKTFYLVGAEKEVIESVIKKLKRDFEGIQILNYRDGFIKNDNEKKELINDIVHKKPDIVFVAMGSPVQELLMEDMQKKHRAMYQGLGGSFDVYAGHVRRAPKWWINNNMEWAYRLLSQPSRITRQIHLIRFFALLQLNKL